MASELTEQNLIDKIADIDASIAAITAELSSTSGAKHVDYSIGSKSVSASQKLAQLMEVRKTYQDLLSTHPKEIIKDAPYEVNADTGEDETDLVGDET